MIARGAAHKIQKAGADDEHEHEVAVAAEKADYTALQGAVEPHIHVIAQDGARQGLEQVGTHQDHLSAMLSQANANASDWAQEHAAELIKGLDATTRERVRELVDQAIAEGWSNDTLADALDNDGVFGDARAEMIARTESAAADVQGNLIGWKESGVVAGKEWKTGAGCCDECEALEGEIVPLDEEFPDGDPPAHPNCRCDVLPVMANKEEAG